MIGEFQEKKRRGGEWNTELENHLSASPLGAGESYQGMKPSEDVCRGHATWREKAASPRPSGRHLSEIQKEPKTREHPDEMKQGLGLSCALESPRGSLTDAFY